MFKKVAIVLSILIIMPFIAGCFEIEERVSIKADGESSLRFKMRLAIPEEAKKKKKKNPAEEVKDKLSDVGSGVEGVEVTEFDIKDLYGQMILRLNMKADSFSALRNAYDTFPKEKKHKGKKPEAGDEIEKIFSKKGFYTIKKKGKKLVIERRIGSKKKRKKAKGKDKEMDMIMAMMGGITMRFDLEVPSKIISSNAEEVDGNTLHWVIPLQYLSGHQVTLKAEIESTPEMTKAILKK